MKSHLFKCINPKDMLTEKLSKLTATAMRRGPVTLDALGSSSCNSICKPINPNNTLERMPLHSENSCAESSPAINPSRGNATFKNAVHRAINHFRFRTCSNVYMTRISIVVTPAAMISTNRRTSPKFTPFHLMRRQGRPFLKVI